MAPRPTARTTALDSSANRRLQPKEDALLGHGHVNLQTDLGKLDVLCELGEGEGYDEILADTVLVDNGAFKAARPRPCHASSP